VLEPLVELGILLLLLVLQDLNSVIEDTLRRRRSRKRWGLAG
jgi:hypothetical protein